MRLIRLVIAVLLAASVAVLPVSAGVTKLHAAKAAMSMSAPDSDCPCCNAAHKCATDVCTLKCYNTVALAVEQAPFAGPFVEPLIELADAAMSPFLQRPDPPPPRS